MHACSACIVSRQLTFSPYSSSTEWLPRVVWVALYDKSQSSRTGEVLLPVPACSFAAFIPAMYSAPAGTALTLMSFSSGG